MLVACSMIMAEVGIAYLLINVSLKTDLKCLSTQQVFASHFLKRRMRDDCVKISTNCCETASFMTIGVLSLNYPWLDRFSSYET